MTITLKDKDGKEVDVEIATISGIKIAGKPSNPIILIDSGYDTYFRRFEKYNEVLRFQDELISQIMKCPDNPMVKKYTYSWGDTIFLCLVNRYKNSDAPNVITKYYDVVFFYNTLIKLNMPVAEIIDNFERSFNMFKNWFYINALTYDEATKFIKDNMPNEYIDIHIEQLKILYTVNKRTKNEN